MRIGILGGGQLGRMLALAAHSLGHEVLILAEGSDEPACRVARSRQGSFGDVAEVAAFARAVDVLTYEFENVPHEVVRAVEELTPVLPSSTSLRIASDRVEEKSLFARVGIQTARWAAIDSLEALRASVAAFGGRTILKTRRFGYDGKGQAPIDDPTHVEGAYADIAGAPAILEARVAFKRELSILGVRGRDGRIATYPLAENVHERGILRRTLSPAVVDRATADAAREAMQRLLEELGHVGVLALELFDTEHGLLANEIAPRVHNTGHFSIEGSATSQFENHIRAITGQPLGATTPRGVSWMRNCIGRMPSAEAVLALEDAHLHAYGKTDRRGRKVGHVTLLRADREALTNASRELDRLIVDDG